MHDIRVTFSCDGSWKVYGSTEPTVIPESDLFYHEVNPQNCSEYLHTRPEILQLEMIKNKNSTKYKELAEQVEELTAKSER
jgi:hypothetical protein